jgi:phosphate uptake regulator
MGRSVSEHDLLDLWQELRVLIQEVETRMGHLLELMTANHRTAPLRGASMLPQLQRQALVAHAQDLVERRALPLATLSTITALCNLAAELVSIADYAECVLRTTWASTSSAAFPPPLRHLAIKVYELFRQALRCLDEQNPWVPERIQQTTLEATALYQQAFDALSTCSQVGPGLAPEASLLLWLVHDLERIAHHSALVAQQALRVDPPGSFLWIERQVGYAEQVGA